jgi:hypothetical protein
MYWHSWRRNIRSAAVVDEADKGRALLVFRSEEEAEKYRSTTGNYPETEGFKAINVGYEELADLVEIHDCTHVAMPEPWTGKGGVDFFKAADYVGMLRESLPA